MTYLLVLTSVPSLSCARKMSAEILQKKLAACISISSKMESHYPWKGKMCVSKEFLLFIKTRESCYTRLEKMIHMKHPYDVPEILALHVKRGSDRYLSWLEQSLAK